MFPGLGDNFANEALAEVGELCRSRQPGHLHLPSSGWTGTLRRTDLLLSSGGT